MQLRKVNKVHLALLAIFAGTFVWSAIHPRIFSDWIVQAIFILLVAEAIIYYYKRFKFTTLTYVVITLWFVILLIAAHDSWDKVWIFEWTKGAFGWKRNNFDRVAHFFQGVTFFLAFREIIIRLSPLKKTWWASAFAAAIALSFALIHELNEWIGTEYGGVDLIGSQGDQFDTQKDMFNAFCGVVFAYFFMKKYQNRQLEKLEKEEKHSS